MTVTAKINANLSNEILLAWKAAEEKLPYGAATELCDDLQKVLDGAYDKWMDGYSMQQWFEELTPKEKAAVALGKFNQQVTNGGFDQWWGNGYAEVMVEELIKALRAMPTSTAKPTLQLVNNFLEACKNELDQYAFDRNYGSSQSYCECQPDEDEGDDEDEDNCSFGGGEVECRCGHEARVDNDEHVKNVMDACDTKFYKYDGLFLLEATAYVNSLNN